jgi:hypothetical protein
VASNDISLSTLPTSSVWRQSPLLASQILIVLSSDADASRVESCEKATDQMESLWPLSVWRQLPLLASQILIVLSSDADASRVESCEKATDQMELLWPSSVWRHALHSSLMGGFIVIHFGSSCLKRHFIKLRAGLNRRADAYA